MATDAQIEAELLRLADARREGATFCPSEAARVFAHDWRPLMDDVRRIAADLQGQGRLVATQKGESVDAAEATGPIRLAAPPAGPPA